MKKLVTLLLAALIAGSMATVALAEPVDTAQPTSTPVTDRQKKIEEKRKQIEDKKKELAEKQAANAALRAALLEKRTQLLNNRAANLELISENNSLRTELKAALKAGKDSGTALTQQTLDALKAKNAAIKTLAAGIKATKGAIKDQKDDIKAAVKAKDLEKLNSLYDGIYAIQADRKDKLTQINALLQEMLTLVK